MRCYIVDTFTDTVFRGNPAAVCIPENWLPVFLMRKIAMEHNLSETAFAVKKQNGVYELRWFTPGGEIELCGHATLATAYVITHFVEPERLKISFLTKSGCLQVERKDSLYEMDFPAYPMKRIPVTPAMEQAIGCEIREAWLGRDLVCVLKDVDSVCRALPDQQKVKPLDGLLLHLTASGNEYDCVTRTFAPKLGIVEDPVCGSGHCHVIPLWADKLKKRELRAFQASSRGGILLCRISAGRVSLAGNAVLYSVSELFLPQRMPDE